MYEANLFLIGCLIRRFLENDHIGKYIENTKFKSAYHGLNYDINISIFTGNSINPDFNFF